MFCEKCGNKLEDNSKFCTKCGNPVAQEQPTQAPAQQTEQPTQAPAQQTEQPTQAPVQQTEQPTQAPAQQTEQPTQAPVQQTEAPYQTNQAPIPPAPKAPRQPMPKKIKNLIIFGSIGLGVVIIALIALFAFIIPSISKVDASKYVTVDFETYQLYEGKSSATVKFDYDKIQEELLDNKNLISQYTALNYVQETLEYCNLEVTVEKADESSTEATGETKSSDYSTYSNYVYLTNLSSTDTVVVKMTWDNTEYAQKSISSYESQSGIRFDHSDKTVTIKVSDMLEKQGITLEESVVVDLLGQIVDGDHLKSVGTKNDADVYIEDFSFVQGDYKFAYTRENGSFRVTDTAGKEIEDSIYVSISNYYSAKVGDEITLSTYSDGIYDTNIFFERTEIETTVPAPDTLTATSAKENIDILKTFFEENVYSSSATLEDIYFLENTDVSGKYENGVVYAYSYKLGSTTYYYSVTYLNCYIDQGVMKYNDYGSTSTSSKDASDIVENNKYMSDSTYTYTKIS